MATSGQSTATPAPPGYYVPGSGATAALAAPVGSYVATIGSAAAEPCPADSESYGGSPACRALAEGAVGSTGVASPQFTANADFNLGMVGNGPSSLAFTLQNFSNDLGFADKVSDLTLLSYAFTGLDAGFFSLGGFTPGTVLHEGDLLNLLLSFDPTHAGVFSATLQFFTDQYASFGADGKTFSYTVTATVAAVPEPPALALAFSGLGALGWLARRKAQRRKGRADAG